MVSFYGISVPKHISGLYCGLRCVSVQNRDYFSCIVPRFGAVRAQNWSQVEVPCPKWCNFKALVFPSTYQGNIGGQHGSLCKIRTILAALCHVSEPPLLKSGFKLTRPVLDGVVLRY